MTINPKIITALLVLLRRGNTVRQAVTVCVPSQEISEWLQYAIDAGVDPDQTVSDVLGLNYL